MLIPIGWQLKLRRLQRHLETGDWLASHSITAQFRHVFPRGDWSKAAFDHLSARALDPITSNVNAIDANLSLASISTTESKCVCVCVCVCACHRLLFLLFVSISGVVQSIPICLYHSRGFSWLSGIKENRPETELPPLPPPNTSRSTGH